MLYVCVGDVMDVIFSLCIVTRGAVEARVWEVYVLRHADVVCLCHHIMNDSQYGFRKAHSTV